MSCDDVLELIEPAAAGDVVLDARLMAHIESCRDCTAAFTAARQIDRLLRARPVPLPPVQFTARTLTRIRRDRWRREQFLDAAFNMALAVAVAAVIAGAWLLMDRTGLSAVGRDTFGVLGAAVSSVAGAIRPAVPLYAGAAALIGTALVLWWWAERDASY
jgi:predicted anti-sigma-YlaC factor YlaD